MYDSVTNRYTEALFALAKSRGVLDDVARDVEAIGREMASPTVANFVVDARIPQETRRDKIAPVLTGVNELTRNFVHLLFDKRREDVLKGVAGAFRQRMLDEAGSAEGVVESARPLGADELNGLATAVGARIGKRVTLENRVRPELVGGLRVLVGSSMLDMSVQGRLEGLRNTLLSAALPSPAEA